MRPPFFLLATVLFAYNSALAVSPHPAVSESPPPAWIIAPPEVPDTTRAVNQQPDYHLIDIQWHIPSHTRYFRAVITVNSSDDLSWIAERAFDFSPEFQTLALHHIRVTRNDITRDILDLAAFDIIRQERERARALYNGTLTAVLQLRDIRVGDTIDYAFSVTGQNPVFGDGFFASQTLGLSVPIRRLHYRLIAPAELTVYHRQLGPDTPAPIQTDHPDGTRSWTWSNELMSAFYAESEAPSWHFTYPFVMHSTHADWAAVVAWALPLYSDYPADPAVQLEVDRIAALHDTPEARLIAALEFVQNDIRYLGIMLGDASHRPNPPGTVLANRFGDCKDKTVLFCAIIRALGFEAYPALVETSYGVRLAEHWQPSPLAFDHAIAQVVLPDGTIHWFDPTATHQAGDLEQRASHDFGDALVIRPGENSLRPMSTPAAALPRRIERLSFISRGIDQPGELVVETINQGHAASTQRAYLARTTPEELTKNYLNYYHTTWPGITAIDAVTWEDDTRLNRLTVRERYTLPVLWKPDDEGGHELTVTALLIRDSLAKPSKPVRTAPLATNSLVDTRVDIELQLHSSWTITHHDRIIEGPAFSFTSKSHGPEETDFLRLSYHLRPTRAYIPPEQVPLHVKRIGEVHDQLYFSFTHAAPGEAVVDDEPELPFALNPVTTTVILLTAVACFLLGRSIWRRPRVEPPPIPGDGPSGIRGWLIIPAISLCFGLANFLKTVIADFSTYFDHTIWQSLMQTDNEVVAYWMVADIFFNTVLFSALVISCLLFFTRRREAPIAFIFVMLLNLALQFYTYTQSHSINIPDDQAASPGQATRTVFALLIWGPYFLVSKRVKNTFVR